MDRVKIYPESHGRIPIVPLDFDQRQLAQPKEIMIDYSNQDLYIVDKDVPSTFYNLTTILTTKVSQNIDANLIYIDLDNIGHVRLKTYLEEVAYKTIKVAGIDASENALTTQFDNRSVECLDGQIQIAFFDNAPQHSFLKKNGDTVSWSLIRKDPDIFDALKETVIELGPYAVEQAVLDLIHAKQDKLIAGHGVVIENNVISVDDTVSFVDDVKVDGVSVVTNKIANINLSGKQDVLIAGRGIDITNNNISSTISAGRGISIDSENKINSTLTAGDGITIDENNVIRANEVIDGGTF